MKRPLIVFDLGGVLIDVVPGTECVAALADASGTPPERLQHALRESFEARPFSLSERFQAGELDEPGFLHALEGMLAHPVGHDYLRGHLEWMLQGEIPGTPELLDALVDRHRVACYSNTNPVHWRHALDRFGFMQKFEPRLASHEVGLVKPDPRVFDYMESQLAVDASECVLIDDRPNNVAAARAAGWQALRFTDAADLRRDLVALGLL